jgi:hypothetical protein
MTFKRNPTKKVPKGHHSLKHGYRSGLEYSFADDLEAKGITYTYEEEVIKYTKPESSHRYTPDFIVTTKSGKQITIETKGRFLPIDRIKHQLVQRQYPDLDLRFVFTNSKCRLSKRSKTTYGQWCERHGFKYANRLIPVAWLNE